MYSLRVPGSPPRIKICIYKDEGDQKDKTTQKQTIFFIPFIPVKFFLVLILFVPLRLCLRTLLTLTLKVPKKRVHITRTYPFNPCASS